MPWNSEGGGGGGQGPWGQGPWGQGGGPRRPNPGGRGPNPSDLDDLIRKGQDKLKQVLPQGGGGSFGWLLAKPTVASVIAGATKPEQIASNVHAGTTWTPTAEDVAEIDRITAAA